MARRPRLEIEGGLYHLIVRGNNRQNIFHSEDDYRKFLSLLGLQKHKLQFYLYAYCLMTNHVHLLVERQQETIGRIMHRVLTGYSQYYNRRYHKVGHVFQGRYKAILCQSDKYLTELVRYIHLNPVRAKMVRRAENYLQSSQRSYLGIDPTGIVDVDSVLRHFGARKKQARENFAKFVFAGMKLGHCEEFYMTGEANILGTEEFVDSTIHRLGYTEKRTERRSELKFPKFDGPSFIALVESICRMPREEFCAPNKAKRVLFVKEALIVSGRKAGATFSELAQLTGLSSATISKRHDAAIRKLAGNDSLRKTNEEIFTKYLSHRIEESKA